MNKELNEKRTVDTSIEKSIQLIKSDYQLIPDIEIKAWKAYLVIIFVVGFTAALIWSAYLLFYPVS